MNLTWCDCFPFSIRTYRATRSIRCWFAKFLFLFWEQSAVTKYRIVTIPLTSDFAFSQSPWKSQVRLMCDQAHDRWWQHLDTTHPNHSVEREAADCSIHRDDIRRHIDAPVDSTVSDHSILLTLSFAPEFFAYHLTLANVLNEIVARSTGSLLEELQCKASMELLLERALISGNGSGLRAAALFACQFLSKFNPGQKILGYQANPNEVEDKKDLVPAVWIHLYLLLVWLQCAFWEFTYPYSRDSGFLWPHRAVLWASEWSALWLHSPRRIANARQTL